MNKFKVSVIIPNYNGEKLIQKNLPQLLKEKTNKDNQIYEIIIVDDGSIDNSVKVIKKSFSEVRVIRHTKNRGFSASVNTGVRSAKGDLVLLLNTDVLPKPNFLKPVLSSFEDEKVFAVSLHEKGYGPAKGIFTDGYIGLAMGEEAKEVVPSFYVSGGSGVFSRKIWHKLGGMDEKVLSPFYWEDIDICYRAAKRGYINLWNPYGKVVHKHESTISKFPRSYVQRVRERNQLLCIWKNISSKNLMRKHVAGVLSRLVKHPGYIRVVIMALGRLSVTLKARKKEMKASKISDEAIFARYA